MSLDAETAASAASAAPVDLPFSGLGEETAGRRVFSIGDLAREFDVTARTLRFYEEKGLIAPQRQGDARHYSRRDRARLKLVLMGKAVGFSLEEIGDMLDLYDLGDGGITQLTVAQRRFGEKIQELEARRAEIDRTIGELDRARRHVAERLAALETDAAPETKSCTI